MNVYFLGKKGEIFDCNEMNIIINGMDIGPSDNVRKNNIHFVHKKEDAQRLLNNNSMVMREKQMKIFEEGGQRQDQVFIPTISFKFPLYDQKAHLKGVFGITIIEIIELM